MRPFSILLTLSLSASAAADVVLLKKGQRIEGKVTTKGSSVAVETELATITLKKSEIEKIVPSPEALIEKARALFKEGTAIEGDAKAIGSGRERRPKPPRMGNTRLRDVEYGKENRPDGILGERGDLRKGILVSR